MAADVWVTQKSDGVPVFQFHSRTAFDFLSFSILMINGTSEWKIAYEK